MTKVQKIKNIIVALIMIVCAAILIGSPDFGYLLILAILDITLFVSAIRGFIYYCTMARFMVDGRRILYKNLLILDLAIFCCILMTIPGAVVMTYLVCFMGFTAVIDIIYGIQAKKLGSPVWKKKIVYGVIEFIIVILCIVFSKGFSTAVYLYAIGIIYKAFTKIAEVVRTPLVSFRHSAKP